MKKREVDEDLLKTLIESHKKQKSEEISKRERDHRVLGKARRLLNGWGPTMVVAGMACIVSAPTLTALSWIYGGIFGGILAATGNVIVATGIAGTLKTAFNDWAADKQHETKLLLEDLSYRDELDDLEEEVNVEGNT
jgi:hypothetical protein